LPPQVLGLDITATQVYRGGTVELIVNATDEFDLPGDLRVELEYRLAGGQWSTFLLGMPYFGGGMWRATFSPHLDSVPGWYDIRVRVTDEDAASSAFVEYPSLVHVLNNLPTAPVVRISPERPTTEAKLTVEVVGSSRDVESTQLTYRFRWYLDGMPMDQLTTDSIEPTLTMKGQNWSVEVRAYDGVDEGLPGRAWTVIENSAPRTSAALPSVLLEEDVADLTSLNLAEAFMDPDGDALTWRLETAPKHLDIGIDIATGRVSVRPEADWNGAEEVRFIASDGQSEAMQAIMVTVQPVNDAPRFTSVNGQPIVEQPVRLTVLEDQPLDVIIDAFDVEDSELRFSCDQDAFAIDIRTGQLTFKPDNSDVGDFHVNVTVWEVAHPDIAASLLLIVTVENVNDQMDEPKILSPPDGSLFKEDQEISFLGACSDPDIRHGQVLNFTWSSDISGILGYGLGFSLRGLAPGNHTITLTVRDSEYTKSTSIGVDIEAVVTPPVNGGGDETPVVAGSSLLLLVIVLIVVVVVVLDVYLIGARRKRDAPASPPAATAPEPMVELPLLVPAAAPPPAPVAQPQSGGYALEEASSSTMVWRPSPSSMSQGVPAPAYPAPPPATTYAYQPPPPPPPEPSYGVLPLAPAREPTAMEAEEAAQAREEREVMRALTQLPQGLPTSLWGWDMSELSRAVVSGPRRTESDGTEMVLIKGRWFNADRTNVGRFMRELKEGEDDKKAPPPEADDRNKRMDKLEAALLEGKISEQTYKELKAKYERR
jgi:hypothetical protein